MAETIIHDLLILGSGLAGLRAALAASIASKGKIDIGLVSKVQLMRSHSVAAEGGTAAMILAVRMKDGTVYEQFVRYPKGNPNHPMSEDEVQAKFHALAARTLPAAQVDRLSELLLRLETVSDIGELMDAARVP